MSNMNSWLAAQIIPVGMVNGGSQLAGLSFS